MSLKSKYPKSTHILSKKKHEKNVHYYCRNSFVREVEKKVTAFHTLNAFENIIEFRFSNLSIITRMLLLHLKIFLVELLADFIKMFVEKIIIHFYSGKYNFP